MSPTPAVTLALLSVPEPLQTPASVTLTLLSNVTYEDPFQAQLLRGTFALHHLAHRMSAEQQGLPGAHPPGLGGPVCRRPAKGPCLLGLT